MGERKIRFETPAPEGRDEPRPSGAKPRCLQKQAAKSNSEATSTLPWTATLEAKRAGWEREWTSDHLEPLFVGGRRGEYDVLPRR